MEDFQYLEQLIQKEEQLGILSFLEDNKYFPWFYEKSIVEGTDDYFGFSHSLILNKEINSKFFDDFYFIVEAFEKTINYKIKELIRIRIRMTTGTNTTSIVNAPHVDHDEPHKVFIYYFNDSDGDTVFYDNFYGENIENLKPIRNVSPIMGNAVMFNGLRYHSGSIPSKGVRFIMNVDYN